MGSMVRYRAGDGLRVGGGSLLVGCFVGVVAGFGGERRRKGAERVVMMGGG